MCSNVFQYCIFIPYAQLAWHAADDGVRMVRKKKILAQSSGCRPQPMCSGHAKEARSSATYMVSCCMETERSQNSPCCSYTAVVLLVRSCGAGTEQHGKELPKEWSQRGWSRTRTPKQQKSILRRISYICSVIPTQPFELACVSERCAVQLGVTLEAGRAYLAEPGLSVLTRSYDGLYSHHGPSSGD